MADGSSTSAIRLGSRLEVERAVDSISSLPDVILQHILSFVPTKLAIGTSLLLTRWRHVWCDLPSLPFCAKTQTAASINETLTLYTAPKMMDFHLKNITKQHIRHLDMWIKFAMSHNVENLSLDINSCGIINDVEYKFPDFFFINSSVKQLSIRSIFDYNIIPKCSVSWTSLKKLCLDNCVLSEESMAKIISGCPFLESLSLYFCNNLKVLDLSKSLRLRALEVSFIVSVTEIVAPHTHYLRLRNSQLSRTLVDAASLTHANLDICFFSIYSTFEADIFQANVLKMLGNFQNVEKLTFGGNLLQVLSLAEVLGVPFPKFKFKALTFETVIFRYVIPGIERLLQNSPDLEKLTLRARDCNTIKEDNLDHYLNSRGLDKDQCWRSKDGVSWNKSRWNVEVKHVVSLVELVFKNAMTLDKMVVLLNQRYLRHIFEDLVPTFSHNNNVFISLSTNTPEAW
ncbi:unnamed protein product [Microthlaspi erraticum]|uniref:At1g61320/AtMIF1 LRR domain-containing protein n=1 Tax=Microthlaspi erraticum TaxID=1685480 RepID=A0A6D2IU89_9BRAS|nr:unnamed protein product [Microthlaspi erraticum]